MNNDTDHPDARPEPSAPFPAGTFLLPTAYGRELELDWVLSGSPVPGITFRAGHGAAFVTVDLGPKALVVAALRSLARDIEAAPAWSAVADIAPGEQAA